MNNQTVTVQITLDNSNLYFRDIGEMLSRHVSELCSKGNFAHDFAAGIYRALADQLENADFDGELPEKLEQLARKGFDDTMYGADKPEVTLNIQTVGFGSDDDDNRSRSIVWKFRESTEAKKLQAIFEKYVSAPETIGGNPIRILTNDIVPRIDDFKKAQSLLQELATTKGLRIEKSERVWKEAASVDDILKEEDKIIFYEDILTDYYWNRLITNCLIYSFLEAKEDEISDFVTAYGKLPDGFQTADTGINNSFLLRTQEVRDELQERLRGGMFIDDIKSFGQEYGLSVLGIPIKKRVEHLERTGVVSKGKRKGKVFYSLSAR